MNKKARFRLVLFITIFTSLLIVIKSALAVDVFNLSYLLTEGGYRLEFNDANYYKGVKVQVTTDVASQYEVVQKIVRPLEKREKPGVFLRNNFVVKGIIGTNQYGNIRVSTSEIPVRDYEVLYVSNATGNQDNFSLIYGLVNVNDLEPGDYSGTISFTLQPIGGSQAPVIKNLDVFVTVPEQVGNQPKIEIRTFSGLKSIRLSSRNQDSQSCDVIANINGRFYNSFRIVQFMPQPLESKEGIRLDNSVVNFVVKEVRKCLAPNQESPLTALQQPIYTSAASGDADSNFVVTYSLGDLSKQLAGLYRSRIQYFLEEQGVPARIETMELEADIERIFKVVLTSEDNKGVIEFSHVKPGEEVKRNEVIVQVNTNLGKQYQLTQNVYSELTNKAGNKIPIPYFRCRTENLNTKGTLKITNVEEVKKGDTTLLVSDSLGSPDKFKVIYELGLPKNENVQAGDYSTRITYSLLEK